MEDNNFEGVPTAENIINIEENTTSFDDLLNSGDLLLDPLTWQDFDELARNSEAPNSSSLQHKDLNPSVPPAQYDCSCCQILVRSLIQMVNYLN